MRVATVRGHTILTASGAYYDLTDPETWDGSIYAVAQGLANTCRFGGQIPNFYSVAEHSVLVADLVREAGGGREEQIAALLHDAHEAFYGDIVSPLKALIGHRIRGAMERFDRMIERRLGLSEGALAANAVKEADLRALRIEAGWLWPECPEWADAPAAETRALVQCMKPTLARNRLLAHLRTFGIRDGRSLRV